MNNNDYIYERIAPEEFTFTQVDANIHDTKLETKSRGFFADAVHRFKKNRASVIGAWVLLLLALFSLLSPIISRYSVRDSDKNYVNFPPFIKSVADSGIGLFNGSVTMDSQNENQMAKLKAIGIESGMEPLIKITGTTETVTTHRGEERINYTYSVKVNKYYMYGCEFRVLSYAEFENIQAWQDATGVQVIYPYVESKAILDLTDANVWYQISDSKITPVYDDEGNFIPAYSTNAKLEGAPYNSLRIPGDDGSYIYSAKKSGAVQCRVNYFNYYTYQRCVADTDDKTYDSELGFCTTVEKHQPQYIMGTNSMGQDLFCAIGVGSRFSLIFAIVVSAINLTIGAVYGAIQGYYGGVVDLVMDRICDILVEVPTLVVTILFQLHIAPKVGAVPAFLFAFVATGWIGMAALTRKQFYRFKSQEFVLAARTLGASDWRLMFKHVFPNAIGTIITRVALIIPSVVLSETTYTYLGIVNIADFAGTSLGTLISQGQTSMTSSPHAMFYPALYFALLLISFNLFGNGLRDAFNPSTRGVED